MNPSLTETRPLIIIDNNLLDDRGHHLALARIIANQALEDGRDVHFYVYQDFRAPDIDPRIVIHPCFETSTYEVFAKKLGNVDLSPQFGRVFEQVTQDHATQGAEVLMHTCDAHIFRAFARWIDQAAFKSAENIAYHLCTCYEIRLLPGAAVPTDLVSAQIWKIARSEYTGRRVFLWGETERLADYYQLQFRTHVEALPLPTPQWITRPPADIKEPGDKVTLLFLGAAREEKGFLELPELAKALAEDPVLAEKIVLRIQCSEPIAGHNPPAREAIERLLEAPCCSLIHGPLSVEAYGRELLAADLIWLKYRPANYFARGSGIVMEAFSAGKYVLNSPGMFVDQMDDMGLTLPVDTIEDCVARLRDLAENLPARRAHAAEVGARMAARYSAAIYLQRLSNRARQSDLLRNLAPGLGGVSYPLLAHPPSRAIEPEARLSIRQAPRISRPPGR